MAESAVSVRFNSGPRFKLDPSAWPEVGGWGSTPSPVLRKPRRRWGGVCQPAGFGGELEGGTLAALHALQQLANRSAVPPGVDIARPRSALPPPP